MNKEITAAAANWHLAAQRDDMDWDGFTVWLEADSRHREAYDAVAAIDSAVDRHRDALLRLVAAPEDRAEISAARGWKRWTWGIPVAAAASLAVALLIPRLVPQAPPPDRVYVASAGSVRTVTMRDGSQINLSAGSKLTIRNGDADNLGLEGTALFDVPHRPDRSLVVHAGTFAVQDIGTRFEIASTPSSLRVAVSRGSVSVASESFAAPVRIEAGRRMLLLKDSREVELGTIHPAAIGAWRRGQLVYENAPLALVVAEINQYARTRVVADSAITGRRFSGVLTIGDGSTLAETLAQVMGLKTRTADGVVRLVAGPGD